ncbi:MAG: hypothetical protein AAGE80_07555 [Pseudomonadota bacterium]
MAVKLEGEMRAVFVVGTGRSGTHFLLRSLKGFSKTYDPHNGKEYGPVLKDIAKAAIHHRLPSKDTEAYYRRQMSETSSVLLDQHHPNLFFAEHWKSRLDDIVFLYLDRPTVQIVASMMRHKGVQSWYSYATNWRRRTIDRIPYPNRFLGVDHFREIRTLPLHLLCARRVIAHRRAYEAAYDMIPDRMRRIFYEDLVSDPNGTLTSVFSDEEQKLLGNFELVETPKQQSLSKFLDVLDAKQIAEIEELEESAR